MASHEQVNGNRSSDRFEVNQIPQQIRVSWSRCFLEANGLGSLFLLWGVAKLYFGGWEGITALLRRQSALREPDQEPPGGRHSRLASSDYGSLVRFTCAALSERPRGMHRKKYPTEGRRTGLEPSCHLVIGGSVDYRNLAYYCPAEFPNELGEC